MRKEKEEGGGKREPHLTGAAEAARQARAAKLAAALRANLARRKADLAQRQEPGGEEAETEEPGKPR